MQLDLYREPSNDICTIGRLYVNDQFECYTLEDPVRVQKVRGITAIPFGTYKVLITYSPRFMRPLPLLMDVPGFSGIRIHPGNFAKDTEGCILPGLDRQINMVGRSRLAFDALYTKLMHAKKSGEEIQITIKRDEEDEHGE